MNKMDIKSLIIGFLLASCMFLFMGNTTYERDADDSQIGKYQITGSQVHGVLLLDTEIGQLYRLNGVTGVAQRKADWEKFKAVIEKK